MTSCSHWSQQYGRLSRMANTDWPDLKFIVDWLITYSTDSKYLNLLFALQYLVFLQKDLATFTTNEGWSFLISGIWRTIRSSKNLRHPKRREIRWKQLPQDSWREIQGKYREAPRIDYGVKHKASLLIMHIYTCVLMLYKGRRSRTHPVYSLFKFQSKFMSCKCKTVFLLLM